MGHNSFNYLDCGIDTGKINEYYMVNDDLWKTANPQDNGMLCIGCLESRIGRALVRSDFTDAPINFGAFDMSERMKDRMGL